MVRPGADGDRFLPSPVVDPLPERDHTVGTPLVKIARTKLGDVDRGMHGGVRENADAERASR
jgi:hypothetical protein